MAESATSQMSQDVPASATFCDPRETANLELVNSSQASSFARLTYPIGGGTKRIVDIIGALAALIFLAPILLFCAIVVRVTTNGPVIFAHERLGFAGRRFHCFKFRTMWPDAGQRLEALLAKDEAIREEWKATQKLLHDPRVTPIGRFLRKTSLDELPQLFNVLLGDMSLVGPRPIVDAEVSRYGSAFHDYAKARPGITGLWQVSGRSTTSYAERVDLDRRYATEWTLLGDFNIAIRTIGVVLGGTGAH